jgi:hypothetical protein
MSRVILRLNQPTERLRIRGPRVSTRFPGDDAYREGIVDLHTSGSQLIAYLWLCAPLSEAALDFVSELVKVFRRTRRRREES